MGFSAVARHRSKNVLLYRQGGINFIVNAEPASFAQSFARVHGPSICAIAFRVGDAAHAYRACVANGAWGIEAHPGPMELAIPAIKGIGDSLIYLVDRYARDGRGVSIYDIDFVPLPGVDPNPPVRGSPRSTTLRTTSIAGAWTSGRTSTSGCSISARCATSTSRASSRDSSRRR